MVDALNLSAGIGMVITGVIVLMNSFGVLKVLPLDSQFGKPLLRWGWPIISLVMGVLMILGLI